MQKEFFKQWLSVTVVNIINLHLYGWLTLPMDAHLGQGRAERVCVCAESPVPRFIMYVLRTPGDSVLLLRRD